MRQRRLAAALCAAAALAAGVVTIANMPRSAGAAWPSFHDPVGVAQGIQPGRVVWVHNPGATDWAGFGSSEHWYDDSHTDPLVVERMVSQAVRGVAGKSTDAEAWDAIFRHFNQKRGRGDRGYYAGEKITIKLNLSVCNVRTGNVSLSTWDKTDATKNYIDNSPQGVRALLRQLVSTVGVSETDITVGDSSACWPNCYLDQLRAEYPNVAYEQYGSGPYRTAATFSSVPFYWSTSAAIGKLQDYLPTSYAQADYLINFSMLKGHSAGITLCGKNDYGSLIRLPDGWLEGIRLDYYNLHFSLPNAIWSPGTAHYRAIVDLMGHPELGGKTLLYLVDGLYGGYYADGHPYKWYTSPFGGDWPSSIFASQDPVAIDSVGYDFLKAEWPNVVSDGSGLPGSLGGGAEDYLHEAALAYSPPSGTFYDPDGNGVAVQSLGVHEHWNNATQKQYGRNRGLPYGIELVSLTYDTGSIQRAKMQHDDVSVLIVGAVITAAFPDYFYVESDQREFGIRVDKVGHGLTVGKRVNVQGPVRTNPDGERNIAATKITTAGSGNIRPLYVNGKILGGSSWNYDPYTGSGQKGISGGYGLNNIGLLVRISGQVVEIDTSPTPTYYRVHDTSGIEVKVLLPTGTSLPQVGQKISVTGISSCQNAAGQTTRLLRATEQWGEQQ